MQPHTELHPTEKGYRPFQVWSIDTIPGLPQDPEGNTTLVVAVDAFSKWVEVGVFRTKEAAAIAEWLELNLLSRFGTPNIIRSDNGKEFDGEVDVLLKEYGVRRHRTSVGYP